MVKDEKMQRYSRQIDTDNFSLDKQKQLLNAKVLVVGAGGLGSPVLYYLAAVGVGRIGILDFDQVEITNLNRQFIHFVDDIGRNKVDSAAEKIKQFNPDIDVKTYCLKADSDSITEIAADYDVVIDAVDNFETRYIISDACYHLKKPLVEGAVVGMDGILMTIQPPKTPCYRCLYPDFDRNTEGVQTSAKEIGVLGNLPGIIGTLQAFEAVKIITNTGETLSGRLLQFDGLTSTFRETKLKKKANCPLCNNAGSSHDKE